MCKGGSKDMLLICKSFIAINMIKVMMIRLVTSVQSRRMSQRHFNPAVFLLSVEPFVQADIKEISKLRISGPLWEDSPVTSGFTSLKASNKKNGGKRKSNPKAKLSNSSAACIHMWDLVACSMPSYNLNKCWVIVTKASTTVKPLV